MTAMSRSKERVSAEAIYLDGTSVITARRIRLKISQRFAGNFVRVQRKSQLDTDDYRLYYH